jgi:hypothetical protein
MGLDEQPPFRRLQVEHHFDASPARRIAKGVLRSNVLHAVRPLGHRTGRYQSMAELCAIESDRSDSSRDLPLR